MMPYRRSRTSQPQSPVVFATDYGSDAMAYIGSWYGVNTRVGVSGSAATMQFAPTPIGIAPNVGTYGSVALRQPKMLQASGGVMTWIIRFVYNDNGVVFCAFGSGDNNGAYVEQFRLSSDINASYSPGKINFLLRGNNGSLLTIQTTNAVLVSGSAYTVCIGYISGSALEMWINGANVQLTYGSTGFSNSTVGVMTPEPHYAVANFRYSGVENNGNINNKVVLFARIPRKLDCKSISINPWQIFKPRTFLLGSLTSPQILYPTGDVAGGTWLPSTGTDLFACLDETSASDSDYIYTAVPGAYQEFSFADGGSVDPSTGGHVRYRLPAGTGTITAILKQGSTTLQTLGTHTLTGSAQDIDVTITASTANSTDLRVGFTASA